MSGRIIRKAGWVHVEARRLLTARSHGKDAYYVPGGKPEGAETMEEALRREVQEELGIALSADLISMGTVSALADGKDDVMVEIALFGGAPLGTPMPAAEIAELRWLTSAEASLASAATADLIAKLKADNVID